jgi:subfamily B ATP-binding cassette protein MsbA
MNSWLSSLKRGLRRRLPEDRMRMAPGSTRANLENLRPFVARHWRKAVLGVLLILCTTLLGLPAPLITRYLIDQVILAQRSDLILGTALLLTAVIGLGMLAGALQRYIFTHFEQSVLLDIQEALLDRTLRLPKAFFDDKETGYLMSRLMSDVEGLRWFFSGTIVYLASSVLQLIAGVALLFYLEWRLAFAALVILPGLVLVVRYFSSRMRILSHQSMEQQAVLSQTMQETLSANVLVKAFASEKRSIGKIMQAWRERMQISLEETAVSLLANLSIGIFPNISKAVVLISGAYLAIRGDWTLGSLLAFQAYLGNVFGPVQFLATANQQLQGALAALERVSALFDLAPEENLGRGQKVEHLSGALEFKNVSFSYNGSDEVLHDLSFQVRPGECVAIVGPSGVGKTTLISLIMCFYRPTRGEICFDGQSLSDYELASLRQRIGYVSQNPLLLSGTILDNLRYGNPEASEALVLHAAHTAGIHDFITSLPQGYASQVGEKGVNFSEGQKQRLALARALIIDPDILILDEPTSALDSLTERSIFQALPQHVRGKTLFIIAHRLSTVQDADRILLLNEMRLVATGAHRELMENNAYYRALVTNQQIIVPID